MKAIILAAGKGTRMLPLTEHIPKVLVEVNGKPFLYYVLKTLQKAGFDELCLVVGYKKEKIVEFLNNYGFKAELIEQKEQLGTGDAVRCAESFADDDHFLVYYGDNLLSVDDLQGIPLDDEYCYSGGITVDQPEHYGILIERSGFLDEVKEKPETFVGNIANPGIYSFTPDIFTALKEIKPSPRGEIELTDAVNLLARQKKVKVYRLQGYWLDLGRKEDISQIEDFLQKHGGE